MFDAGGDIVTGPDPQPANLTGPGQPRGWRRRQYVVDARYQLRAGVLVGAVAVALLILLNLSLLSQHRPAAGVTASGSTSIPSPWGPSGASWAILLVGSGVFVAGVIAIGVLESHRTAGAAYAIRRSIEQLRDGHSGVRVRLRRGDHLKDLATAFNQLAESLDAERAARR
jgi:hypothetical protein